MFNSCFPALCPWSCVTIFPVLLVSRLFLPRARSELCYRSQSPFFSGAAERQPAAKTCVSASGRPKGCSDLGWDWLKLNRRIIIVLWKLSSSAEATSFCTDAGQGNCPCKGSIANCSGLSSWGSRSRKHRNQAAGQSPLPRRVDGASARATKGLKKKQSSLLCSLERSH